MITIEDMVQRKVMCCMSALVLTLAAGNHGITEHPSRGPDMPLRVLSEQAYELVAPILDYEEAATQAGWHMYAGVWRHGEAHEHSAKSPQSRGYTSAQEACEANSLDPYEWEVYEHWAVSTWLAEKLIAQGERVDTDFAGLNVWARTMTGQAISMDGVIQRVYSDMMKVA